MLTLVEEGERERATLYRSAVARFAQCERQRGREVQACATCRLGVGTRALRMVREGEAWRELGHPPYLLLKWTEVGDDDRRLQAGRPEKRRRPAGRCKETRSGAADRELMRALPLSASVGRVPRHCHGGPW